MNIDKLLNRFMLLKQTLLKAEARDISAYFNEQELNDVISALAELKVLKGDDLR